MLGKLPKFYDENLLVGIETSDDAAVYKVNDEVAMIQTVDFFTPIVDDAYQFGQIAAANALSDVFAMGGKPVVALNIVGFPNCLDPAILGEILRGGADKVKEAGAVLVGGHSVQNDEPQYGLCVSGFVHPDHIWKNQGARPGDVLVLTKPIGSGLVNTAAKAEMASPEALEDAVNVMATLNRRASEILHRFTVHACTDVTGFGLLGHALEMADPGDISFYINVDRVPSIREALSYAKMGLVPAGSYRNRGYGLPRIDAAGIEEHYIDLLFDPQSSGGLLASVPAEEAEDLRRAFAVEDVFCAFIGDVVPGEEKKIILYHS